MSLASINQLSQFSIRDSAAAVARGISQGASAVGSKIMKVANVAKAFFAQIPSYVKSGYNLLARNVQNLFGASIQFVKQNPRIAGGLGVAVVLAAVAGYFFRPQTKVQATVTVTPAAAAPQPTAVPTDAPDELTSSFIAEAQPPVETPAT